MKVLVNSILIQPVCQIIDSRQMMPSKSKRFRILISYQSSGARFPICIKYTKLAMLNLVLLGRVNSIRVYYLGDVQLLRLMSCLK